MVAADRQAALRADLEHLARRERLAVVMAVGVDAVDDDVLDPLEDLLVVADVFKGFLVVVAKGLLHQDGADGVHLAAGPSAGVRLGSVRRG